MFPQEDLPGSSPQISVPGADTFQYVRAVCENAGSNGTDSFRQELPP